MTDFLRRSAIIGAEIILQSIAKREMPVSYRIRKAYSSGEFHYVFGEVYAPDIVDTDGESMSAEDIQKMAHNFIADGLVRSLDTNHNHNLCGAVVVESFIARKGDPDFAEGSWVLGVRMEDGPLWESIKSGEINGFSVDAFVTKVPSDKPLPKKLVTAGETLPPVEQDGVTQHTHTYYIEYDTDGRVAFGKTDSVDGHSHKIIGTVTTEKAAGHSHRFFVET